MQRYFVENEQFHDASVEITGADVHHLRTVLRAEEGTTVICSDGAGREAIVKLTDFDKDRVRGAIVEHIEDTREPKMNVWLAQSLPKADKLETVIQKGTEIGVVRFLPFMSERTVVRYDDKKQQKRMQRWQKIAKEAAEQAHRSRIPTIDTPLNWKEMLAAGQEADAVFLCYERENGVRLRSALQSFQPDRSLSAADALKIMMVIGPEGGFSEQEVQEAEEQGFCIVGLGRTVLRTETAGPVAAACVLYEFGEMGGIE